MGAQIGAVGVGDDGSEGFPQAKVTVGRFFPAWKQDSVESCNKYNNNNNFRLFAETELVCFKRERGRETEGDCIKNHIREIFQWQEKIGLRF